MVNVDVKDKVLLTIEEASALYNIGINKMTEIAGNPRNLVTLNVGRKRLIKRKEMDEFISKNIEI